MVISTIESLSSPNLDMDQIEKEISGVRDRDDENTNT